MRKTVLMILLAIVSNNAMANWTKISGSDARGAYDIYTDKATIVMDGSRVKMWVMSDYKKVQRTDGSDFPPYLSTKRQEEYDCKLRQSRMHNLSIFSGNMGSGKVVYNSPSIGEWAPVSSGTVGMVLWKFACGKL